MSYTPELTLYILKQTTTSTSNKWWANAIRESMKVGGALQTLTEKHLSVDTVKAADMVYIDYPSINEGIKLEPGIYHINTQTASKMCCGWMKVIDENTAIWWAQSAGDTITVGCAGNAELLNDDLIGDMLDNVLRRYLESYPEDTPFTKIINHI